MKNRNYVRNTIRTYSAHINNFLKFSRKSKLEPEKMISVFPDTEESSPEQRRLACPLIKFFYEIVLKNNTAERKEVITI